MRYLDEAIGLDRKALELCPPGHPERTISLTLPVSRLRNRQDQLRATRGLGEAVVLDREALEVHPMDTLIGQHR